MAGHRRVSPIVVGIDGGGTSTIAWTVDGTGTLLGVGAAGSSNPNLVGPDAALRAIRAAVARGLREARTSRDAVAAVAAGIAGTQLVDNAGLVEGWLEKEFPGRPSIVVHDAELVLAAAFPDRVGIAVIAGTGSLAFGRDANGVTARAGGWGPEVGDPGSGVAIGRAALRAVAEAEDATGERTALRDAILRRCGARTLQEFVALLYTERARWGLVAALATTVCECAAEGDPVADAILVRAAGELAATTLAAARRLTWSGPVPCALGGGVFVGCPRLTEAFGHAVEAMPIPLAHPQLVPDPVRGAIVLAERLLQPTARDWLR